ncbi:hypothetical protein [Sphingobacterium suaedae]|uniref:Uncharacterized protein n=1 Tax=Sphingobacterium suaedae TaxID=1686402 RepID=A0ABW5KNE9_9SPHI
MSIDLELTEGLGPKGNFFQSINRLDKLDSTIRLLLPNYKLKGEELADATEYVFMVDKLQFLFQNYVTGKLPKLSFLKEVARNNWNIKDTITLSKDPMNVVIRILVGKNANGKEIYIVDGNQDGSFGDDVARPFANWSAISNKIAESSPVKLDFLAGGKVVTKEIPVVLGKDPTVYTIAAQCFWFVCGL